jgi:succinate dehydrogenase / fumarate reductase, membrane anchor subunit
VSKNTASLQSPLGQVRGLGSAKEGVGHWWYQRLTAIALAPLSILFVSFALD